MDGVRLDIDANRGAFGHVIGAVDGKLQILVEPYPDLVVDPHKEDGFHHACLLYTSFKMSEVTGMKNVGEMVEIILERATL